MNVYMISGLAADKGVFKNLVLPAEYDVFYLEWIPPVKNESLPDYSIRLAEKIDLSKPFILIGLSLGGMIAVEIAKHYVPEKLIIISSIPSSKYLPFYFNIVRKAGLHKFVPVSLLKSASLVKRLFTAETSQDKIYLRKVIKQSDPVFIRWAMNAILHWPPSEVPASYVHIHGSGDEILPLRYTKATHIIKGGGHLMIMNRSGEINEIFKEVLF
jgi:pimeloyl-ACP methyl ester carboxylesterase